MSKSEHGGSVNPDDGLTAEGIIPEESKVREHRPPSGSAPEVELRELFDDCGSPNTIIGR